MILYTDRTTGNEHHQPPALYIDESKQAQEGVERLCRRGEVFVDALEPWPQASAREGFFCMRIAKRTTAQKSHKRARY